MSSSHGTTIARRTVLVGSPVRTGSLRRLLDRAGSGSVVVAEYTGPVGAASIVESHGVDLVIVDMAAVAIADDFHAIRHLFVWPGGPRVVLIASTSDELRRAGVLGRPCDIPVVDCASAAARLTAAMWDGFPLRAVPADPGGTAGRAVRVPARPAPPPRPRTATIVGHFLRGRSAGEIALILRADEHDVAARLLSVMRRHRATDRKELGAAFLRTGR